MGRYRNKERNEEIIEELEREPALEYMSKKRQNCRDNVNGMARGRITRQILQYVLRGRAIEHQAKKWLEAISDHVV
jgi:hypothetical protein